MSDDFKEVTIKDRKYRVGYVSAFDAEWIIAQIKTKGHREREIYKEVMGLLLSACSVNRPGTEIYQQIFNGGKWMAPDLKLENDLESVHDLMEASMELSITPFLLKQQARLEEEEKKANPEAAASSPSTSTL